MNLIFPDPGLVWMLRRVIGEGLHYHLFSNDIEPKLTDTLAMYHECDYSGYAPVPVPAAAWSISAVQEHVGGLQANIIVFFNSSPVNATAYGYFVTDQSNLQLVCAARFDEAPVVAEPLTSFKVTPVLGSYSGLSQ